MSSTAYTPAGGQQNDPLALNLGVQAQPFPRPMAVTQTAPATQIVYASAVYAQIGLTVSGVKMTLGVSAAGTTPTTARIGFADWTGRILGLSANLNAATSWTAGVCLFAFTAPVTLAYSGIYFPCFVVNGTWGTTQPTPSQAANSSSAVLAADGAYPPAAFQWAAQTDLPAVGSALTMTGTTGRCYWLALY